MFEIGEKVVVIKGPMKGSEGSIRAIHKERDVYAVQFSKYDNPATKTGCYYLKACELDKISKYYRSGFALLDNYSNIRTDKYIPAWISSLYRPKLEIKNILFKEPATIVFWTDNTKTVVKCQDGEPYDPEKGLAMAISKKYLGNDRTYYHTFLKWLKKYNKENCLTIEEFDKILDELAKEGENK